jgi:hypothetical protein
MTVRSTRCWRHILQWSPSTNSTLSLSMASLGIGEGDGDDDSSFIRLGRRVRVGLELGLGDLIHIHKPRQKSRCKLGIFLRLDKIGPRARG